jgi:phenylacetate-coenzyme A ligase PaaK-like adenylate-forming protein
MAIGTVTAEQLRERADAARMALMPELVGRMRLDASALRELQQDRLRTLLAYAIGHSPFWERRLRGIDASRFALAQLAELPPLTKTELMREFDDAVTDRRLNRSLVERALAMTTDAPVPILDGYIAQATGGSSGQRGVFVSDVDAYVEVFSAPLRFLLTSEVGRRLPPDGFRLATVAAATAVHSTGLAAAMTTPGSSPIELHAVPVTLPLTEMVTRLNAARPHVLIGYPSVLARLAGERIAGRLVIEPRGVLTTSEMLTTALRAAIRSGFGAPIIDLFGSTEGLMGGTEPDQCIFVFNSETCLVEPVDGDDRPVPLGTPSAHILVTNLCNRIQPLIRYRLDDRFTRHPDAPGRGQLRATVEGRADDVLRYGSIEIHPLTVRAALLKHPEILDYQVRQTASGIDVSLLADGTLDAPALTHELRAALAAAGLAAPTVAVTRVDELVRHAETGKLRRFVPLAG